VSPQYLVQSYYGAHITWRLALCFGAFFSSLLALRGDCSRPFLQECPQPTTTLPLLPKVSFMHSDNIVKTLDTGQNRFELCHQVFKAIRKLHKPNDRIQDTAADALKRLAGVAQREAQIGLENANDAAGLEVKQEQLAVASVAPPPELMAGGVLPSETSVLVPAGFAATATGQLMPRP
jgi:hypothetical protein